MKYRPEIDGLRAVAVLPVILFHAGVGLFSGGFLGVDVFFVISGYLITTIIVTEVQQGRFSLVDFYERRAKRILPALFVTMALTAMAAPFFLIPSQIKDVAQSIVATAFFLANYFFYLETDYFNQFTNNAPLLHTWSLAVEEQFYIFYPLAILFMARRGRKALIAATLVIFGISLFAAQHAVGVDKSLGFYSIHTRAWELMVGALLALTTPRLERIMNACRMEERRRLLNAITSISMAIVLLSIVLFSEETPHPGFITALPVLATACLIFFTAYPSATRTMLASKIPVGIGLISYGLYLYHNPVYSYITASTEIAPERALPLKLAAIPFIFALAYASYRFIERPIRRSRSLTWRSIFPASLAAMLLFAAGGYYVHRENGFQTYFAERFRERGGVLLVDVDREKADIAEFRNRYMPSDTAFTCGDSCIKLLAIGDSFSEDAYFSLQALHPAKFQVRRIYLDDPCLVEALGKVFVAKTMVCNGFDVNLALIPQADIVLLTEKWQEQTYQSGYDFARKLVEHGTRVFVQGSVMFSDLSSMSLKFAQNGITPAQSRNTMYKYQRWDRFVISEKLRKLVQADTRIGWIEKRNFFCDDAVEECRLFDSEGKPVIWDNAHLTVRNYRRYGRFLEERIFR